MQNYKNFRIFAFQLNLIMLDKIKLFKEHHPFTSLMLIAIVVVDALTQRRAIETARRKRLLNRTESKPEEGGIQA